MKLNKTIKKTVVLLLLIICIKANAQFVVTSTADDGSVGTFRWAILQANSNPNYSTITFNITTGTAPFGIQLQSGIQIFYPVSIDGGVAAVNGEPSIHLKGLIGTVCSIGVIGQAHGTIIKNLTFSDFKNLPYTHAIIIDPSASQPDGTFIKNVIIENSVFYDCDFGITLKKASGCKIKGNYFGTNRSNSITTPNNIVEGVYFLIFDQTNNPGFMPQNNIIGGGTAAEKNYFYNSLNEGIMISVSNNGNIVKNNVFINNKKNINLSLIGINECGNSCKSSPTNITAQITSANRVIISGKSEPGDYIEMYKTNGAAGKDALFLIGGTTANNAGAWQMDVPKPANFNIGDYVIGTATSPNTHLDPKYHNNTSEFNSTPEQVQAECRSCPDIAKILFSPKPALKNNAVNFSIDLACAGTKTYAWDFGDPASGANNTSTSAAPTHTYTSTGLYFVKCVTTIIPTGGGAPCIKNSAIQIRIIEELNCENCIGSFAPEAGQYILSAWVQEDNVEPNTLQYDNAEINIYFPTDPNNLPPVSVNAKATGDIIDGWQRIEKEFTITTPTYIVIELKSTQSGTNAYFDDIRISPKNATMKSFVYDPITLKLVAEQDERNYSTLYEYDEEGKLIRLKKETEKGIMTIQENRGNNAKR